MKASDFIVEFLIEHGITDVFGYPGGMVTHLMESLDKYAGRITAHLNYHEQASAMAACGWAELTGKPGVAYATSGPGATNLLTGIACAYFESIPCIFITGQVNTYEQKGTLSVRQRGFQETDIVSMARAVTKDAYMVERASDLPQALHRAYHTAMEGRRGPVLVDIPMDVFRDEVMERAGTLRPNPMNDCSDAAQDILRTLSCAKKPVIIAGHGISLAGVREEFRTFVERAGIPVVTSMIAVDVLPTESPLCFGMLGAYGLRWANYIVNHSDCILALGSRLDCRQTGINLSLFAPDAKLLRVDIDPGELKRLIRPDETAYQVSLMQLMPHLLQGIATSRAHWSVWLERCIAIQNQLVDADPVQPGNDLVAQLGEVIGDHSVITTDVGQNQVWVAQSLRVKPDQRVLFSGGHGAMGYSLPCAVGAAIATEKVVYCFTGDGGIQMNLQELQTIVRESLPVKIIVLNNHALGMIHHFQEMYFQGNYVQTDASGGFTVPDFIKLAASYGLRALRCQTPDEAAPLLAGKFPALIEFMLPEQTYVYPKLGMNHPIHEQEPPLSDTLRKELSRLCQ